MFVDFQNSYTVGRYLPTLCLWLDWHVFLAHSVLAHCVHFVLQQLISYILRLISDTIVSCLSSASRELRSGSNRTSPVESRSDAGCWSTCANWQRHKHSISDVAASVTSQHQWRRSISDVAASVTSQMKGSRCYLMPHCWWGCRLSTLYLTSVSETIRKPLLVKA